MIKYSEDSIKASVIISRNFDKFDTSNNFLIFIMSAVRQFSMFCNEEDIFFRVSRGIGGCAKRPFFCHAPKIAQNHEKSPKGAKC